MVNNIIGNAQVPSCNGSGVARGAEGTYYDQELIERDTQKSVSMLNKTYYTCIDTRLI